MTINQAKSHAQKNINARTLAPGRLAGKIAVVTGGAQGFGRGIAEELYREGAAVLIADLPAQRAAAEELASELGERAEFCPVDVSDAVSVETMVCLPWSFSAGLTSWCQTRASSRPGRSEI